MLVLGVETRQLAHLNDLHRLIAILFFCIYPTQRGLCLLSHSPSLSSHPLPSMGGRFAPFLCVFAQHNHEPTFPSALCTGEGNLSKRALYLCSFGVPSYCSEEQ